jgi:hypothetical protein
MKKFIITESEKNEILNQHNKFKSILKNKLTEQISPLTGRELINKAKEVCPSLKRLGSFVTSNGKRAIKVVADKDGSMNAASNQPKYVVGDILIYNDNMTYDVYDGTKAKNNTWEKKGTYKWKCAGLTAQSDDFQKTAADQKIKAEGWMTYDEAKAAGVNLSDPKFFEQKKINGVEYFRKRGITIGGVASGSTEQGQVIEFLKDRYGSRFQRLKDTLDSKQPTAFCWAFQGEQPLTEPVWNLVPVVGGDDYGVAGLQIFRNPACLKDVRKASKTVVSTEAGQRRVDNKGCKETIDEYLQAYEDDVDATSTAFQEMKRTVQACKRKFCSKNVQKTQGKCEGNWNLGFMGGSRRMDDIIDFFSGEENSIGNSPSRTNPYRIA